MIYETISCQIQELDAISKCAFQKVRDDALNVVLKNYAFP
jgi:hypothetical protein